MNVYCTQGLANYGYANLRATELRGEIQSNGASINRNFNTITDQGQTLAALEITTDAVATALERLEIFALTANLTGNTKAADILTNAADILTNAANIRVNDGKISTNAADILNNVARILTNRDNIGTNRRNIDSNTGSIVTNKNGITQNMQDIAENKDSIGKNEKTGADNKKDIDANKDSTKALCDKASNPDMDWTLGMKK